MTVVAIECPQCPSPYNNANSPGMSDEAAIISCQTIETQQRGLSLAEDNPSIRSQLATNQIIDIYLECAEDDWDGEGSAAIPYEAVENALDFVSQIPMQYPMPEIFADDGELTFGWNAGRYKKFLASCRGDGFVYYNGIFGFKSTDYGHKSLGNRLHPEIIHHLDKLYPPLAENGYRAA